MKIHHYCYVLLLTGSTVLAQDKLVVGYYPSWMKSTYPYTAIQYQYLSYIAHAFIFPNVDGTIDFTGFTYYPEMIQAAHRNSVGVVISVGGYDVTRTPHFDSVAANPAARTRFVNAVRDFCLKNSYDGVDIDWEYPAASRRANTNLFFQELHDSLSHSFLTLSIAAPAADWSGYYDWTLMKSVLDWIGVMTYDFYGSWTTKVGPNSPLYGNASQTDQGWIDNSVSFYLNRGIPRSKLLIGTPFYGWKFNGSAMYGPGVGTAQVSYSAIVPLLQQGWTRSWDQLARVPYLVNSTQTNVISYDDSASIVEKMKYVNSQSLGGTIIWALGQDCSSANGQSPLLTVLGKSIATPVAASVAEQVPRAFELLQNYPNPFNGRTEIRYTVTRAGHYSLRLYDILGREVELLADADLTWGTYEVPCSSDHLSSGVYVYRLSGEGFSMMRTMIVLR